MQSNSYKIVLIGESMVGKTSILHRYTKGEFLQNLDRTVNSNCLEKDTAGEEKYHALAPIFYRDSDGAVLVFDLCKRESFTLIERWINELKGYAGELRLILVGNKSDMPSSSLQVTNEEAKTLAASYGSVYLPVSAKEDQNISDIFSTLAIEIYHNQIKKEKDKQRRKKSLKLSSSNLKDKKEGCC